MRRTGLAGRWRERQVRPHSFVHRVWHSCGLKPHLVRTFKVSTDPRFEEKLQDVVGLYLNPPENAAVFSFDEKSSIQALDRTQPGLPLKKGRCGTMTHDYKRHGTTSLFAALEVASGQVIGQTYKRHRHQEVLKFLRQLEKAVPKNQEIHIILDNYATHKHPKVMDWIERQKRIFLHFTPTSASWLNLVERFFRHADREATQAWRLPFCAGSGAASQGLHQDLQREPPASGLDKDGRGDSQEGSAGQAGAGHCVCIIIIMLRTLH